MIALSSKDPEPRWPALIAILAIGGLYLGMPDFLILGPRWLVLLLVIALLVPIVVSHRQGNHQVNRIFGFAVSGVITAAMAISVFLLVGSLPMHKESPVILLRSATALWITNVLVFAIWYWRLDAGGPHGRDARPGHDDGAFLFPQMSLNAQDPDGLHALWSPHFIDYLFLAFNTSTALSPADTQALSRWAKVLMMTQASISLVIVILLAARAVNIM